MEKWKSNKKRSDNRGSIICTYVNKLLCGSRIKVVCFSGMAAASGSFQSSSSACDASGLCQEADLTRLPRINRVCDLS